MSCLWTAKKPPCISQVADDKDIVIEAPADIVQRRNDDVDSKFDEAEDPPKRDLNIEQPELKELIEEKIAKEDKEENGEEDTEKGVDADVDTHEGEDKEEKEEEKNKAVEEESAKDKDETPKSKKENLDAKIEAAAAEKKNDDQPALAPPMVSQTNLRRFFLVFFPRLQTVLEKWGKL